MTRISIVIPAYNEEARIGKTLHRVMEYLDTKDFDAEIIVVDDGSTDKTADVVKSIKDKRIVYISNGRNRGKGFTVKNGVFHAKKDWILFSDADLSTPIEEVDLFLKKTDSDVVIGSRAMERSSIMVHQPFYREFSGKIFNLFVQLLTIRGIKDTQCGMKMFHKDAARDIFGRQTIERFGFDVEVIFIAKKRGYSITQVPVRWYNDANTKVQFFRDATRMFTDLLRIRWNDFRGVYDRPSSPKDI